MLSDFNLIRSFFSVLTDAQSKGIVRRLISYHEDAQNDLNHRNRYVYNRVGDFPIVHLKKTELKRNLVRSSSVRIAPPSKQNFNREARAAILRSNSFQLSTLANKVIPVKMRAQDSHSIITNHEPIIFNEVSHSTNNALEDLEKNCRKRINIEELCLDKTKRVCPIPISDSSEVTPPVVDISSIQSQKRAREPTTPEHSSTDSPISQQVKRLRIKNNALFSSLSSSHHELIPKKNVVQTQQQQTRKNIPVAVVEKRQTENTVSILKNGEVNPSSPSKIQQTSVKKLRLFNVAPKQPPPGFRSKSRNFNDDEDDDEFKINFVKPKEKPSNIDVDANQSIEKEKLSRMLHCLGDGLSGTTTEYTRDTVDSQKTPECSKKKAVTFSPVVSLVSFMGTTTTATLATSSITSESLPKPTEVIASSNSSEKQNVNEASIQTVCEPSDKQIEKTTTTVSSVITTTPIAVTEKLLEKPIGTSFALLTPSSTLVSNSIASQPATTLPSLDASKSLINFSPAPVSKDSLKDSTTQQFNPITTTGSVPVLGGFSFSASRDPKIASSTGFQLNQTSTTSSITSTVVNVSSESTKSTLNPPSFQFGAPITVTTSPPSFFTTSTAALTTTISALPAVTFSFSKPNAEQKSPVTEISPSSALPTNNTAKTSFSFGQTNNKPETTQSSGVGFSFGAPTFTAAPLATSASTNFTFNNAEKTTASSTTGGFSFGNSTTTAKIPSPSSTGMFGLQSNDPATTSTSHNMFQSPLTATTSPPKGSIFSRLTDKVPEMNTNNNTPGSFTFGAMNKNNTTSFGLESSIKQPEVKTFNFGGDKKAENVPTFGINTQNNETSKSQGLPGFSFNAQPKLAESKPTFGFGNDKPSEKASFAFGAPNKTVEVKPTFNFASNTTEQKQETPVAFSFAGSKHLVDNKIDNQAKPNLFGALSGSSSNIFGAVTKQDATTPFGSASQTPTFGQPVAATFNTPSTTTVFGTISQQNPPAFGANNNTSAGGMLFGNNNPPTFNQSQGAFGQVNTSNNNGGVFGFNQTNKNELNVQSPQSAPVTGMFNFASSATTNNNQQPTTVFGGDTAGQNVSASFNFKAPSATATPNNSSTNMFGSNQNNASAFQFNPNVTNVSASFTFSPPSASTANAQPPAFNFNPPQSAPAVPTGAFNFQAQNQQQLMPVGNQGGMFNIGVGGGQQKRPFRQATRRLK